MPTAAERLRELEDALREASDRHAAARRRHEREWEVTAETAAGVRAYRDDVTFKRREPDADEQRAVTREFCERVLERGLVLEPHGTGPGLLFVRDPAIAAEVEDARQAANSARAELEAFRRGHRAEIERERKAAEAEAIRRALDGDDPDAIREALGTAPAAPRNVLQSEDVVPA